jgi:ubiquitin-protein ligase
LARSAAGSDMHRRIASGRSRMPYGYPERPPDIRWLTPILHPNISFSGFLNLRKLASLSVGPGARCRLRAALDVLVGRT